MSAEPLQAVLMAGGKGTRLYPYTAVLPKPLLPVGDKPVLEWLLLLLRQHGIRSVALAVNHLHHLIRSFFGDGSALGMRISYTLEDAPLGTSGPIGAVLDQTAADFLVLNGDTFTDIDLTAFMAHHRAGNADLTVAAALHRHTYEYGVLEVDAAGALLSYREKPTIEHLRGLGLYVVRREAVRDLIHSGERQDMPELLGRLITANRRVQAWPAECLWLDIGRPDDYARAQAMAETSIARAVEK